MITMASLRSVDLFGISISDRDRYFSVCDIAVLECINLRRFRIRILMGNELIWVCLEVLQQGP